MRFSLSSLSFISSALVPFISSSLVAMAVLSFHSSSFADGHASDKNSSMGSYTPRVDLCETLKFNPSAYPFESSIGTVFMTEYQTSLNCEAGELTFPYQSFIESLDTTCTIGFVCL